MAAADTPEAPRRTDSNGIPIDNRFHYLEATGSVSQALGVAEGATEAASPPLAQLASFAAANGTGSSALTFTEQTKATSYIIQYWLTATPLVKNVAYVNASGDTLALAAGAYTLRGAAVIDYGRGAFAQGAWSDTDTATVS